MALRCLSKSGIYEEQQVVANCRNQLDVLSVVSLAANSKAPDLPSECLVQ